MAAGQFDGFFRHRSGGCSVAKIGRDEIGLPACCPQFGDRLFATLHVAAHDHDVNA
jgi:hypothetical protein